MAARLWTHGFDFYAPSEAVVYHLWSRDGRRTVDADAEPADAAAKRATSLDKVDRMLRGDATVSPGLGTARPLAAFFERAKLDFPNRKLLPGAEDAGQPPDAFALGLGDLAALGAAA